MTTTEPLADYGELRALYDEVELAIVFDWLGLTRPPPLAAIDIRAVADQATDDYEDDGNTDNAPLQVKPGMYGEYNHHSVGNAVARLVLSRIQGRLPQWGCIDGNGRLILGRSAYRQRDARIELMPRFLFEINWADSGPGFSWPEAYHLVYLPGFHRYVVTASQDSPEMHGYTEEAIGHFPAAEPTLAGCRRIIVDWWSGQARGWEQPRWAYLFNIGEVAEQTIEEWANRVWDPESGEPRQAG